MNPWLIAFIVIIVIVVPVAGYIFVTLGGSADAPDEPGPESFSLRIGTYNVAMLSPHWQERTGDEILEDAARIARRIAISGYDVIVLNELFWHEAADVFRKTLYDHGAYRYCAYNITASDATIDIGSGLAIFSKWPFDDLPPLIGGTGHEEELHQTYVGKADGTDWAQLAFCEFDKEETIDFWASKGVAYAVVKHPQGHSRYHVFFAHLNDDLGRDDTEEATEDKILHNSQLWDAYEFIQKFITPKIFEEENVFFMGDLNIDGNPRNFEFPGQQKEVVALGIWKDHFATPGKYFTSTFWDCHFWEQPQPSFWMSSNWQTRIPEEEKTFEDGHTKHNLRRLDFFIRNAPTYAFRNPLWVQHMTRGFQLQDIPPFYQAGPEWDGALAGHGELSDHYALAVDLNRANPHCSVLDAADMQALLGSGFVKPLDPEVLKAVAVRVLGDKDVDSELSTVKPGKVWIAQGAIVDPGAMQWLKIEEAGTYSIGFIGDEQDLEFRLYAKKDFTVPIPQYRDKYLSNGLTEPFYHTVQIGSGTGGEGTFDEDPNTPPTSSGPNAVTISFPELPFTGKTFVVSDPPFYIRVFHQDRKWTGGYRLQIQRHGCTGEQDLCYLEPYRAQTFSFASDALTNAQTDAYFAIDLERLDSGEPQELKFWADCLSEPLASLTLGPVGAPPLAEVKADPAAPQVPPPWDQDPGSTNLRHVLVLANDQLVGPAEMRLVVSRANPGPAPAALEFSVGWMTNLTVLFGDPSYQLFLRCEAQDDYFGDDSISLGIIVDGIQKLAPINIGQFDDEQQRPLINITPSPFPIRFAKRVDFNLYERDNSSFDEHVTSFCGPLTPDGVADLTTQGGAVNGQSHFGIWGVAWNGKYDIYYRLSHGLQWKKD